MADLLDIPGLRVRRAPAEPLHVLHCDPADSARVGAAIGLQLPLTMLQLKAGPGGRALHLAPDEWLLCGWAPATELDLPSACSLVEVSSRSLTLSIEGELAEALLAAGCPLDFSRLQPGACTRTLFGKVQIMLERGEDCFRMQYGRSFDGYVTEFVKTAASDLPEPGTG